MKNAQIQPIPKGMHTVTPHLICAGAADAIEFYQEAFGATELSRLAWPNGRLMHAMIRIGDSNIMLVDESPDWGMLSPLSLASSPVTIHLYVEDVDAFVARAEAAGAKVTMPPADMFWGDRYCQFTDPFGHHWSAATHVHELSAEEIQEAAKHACG